MLLRREAVLLQAGDEYEERKIRYIARLYAALCFRADVGSGYGHYLLTLAQRMTYRQLCMLALFSDDSYRDRLVSVEMRRTVVSAEAPVRSHPGVIAELDQLGNEGVLGVSQPGGSVFHFATVYDGGTFGRLALQKIAPLPVGSMLIELLSLDDVPASTVAELLAELGE